MEARTRERMLTIDEAEAVASCSSWTIRRAIKDGRILGAHQDGQASNAQWRIPLSGLVAAGLVKPEALDRPAIPREPTVATVQPADHPGRVRLLEEQLRQQLRQNDALQAQNAQLLHLLAHALGADLNSIPTKEAC